MNRPHEPAASAPPAGDPHIRVRPKILYFGTPVALVTTLSPDGSANIGPMSSACALGDTVVLGWATGAQTTGNLRRERECVINLPDASLHEKVEALAPLTGRNPPPAGKAARFHYEPDKFGAAGWTPQPARTVAAPRIAECALQLEASVQAIHDPVGPDGGDFVIVETRVEYVHAHPGIVVAGTDHIDPERWTPLLYVFRHYFGTGAELGRTFRAEY
jgi:flavin reductase (DIM6/NTAB) family NADH-FMN oxidoreductase RutF